MKLRSLLKAALLVAGSALLIAAVSLLGIIFFLYHNSGGGQDWSAPVSAISDTLTPTGAGYAFTGEALLEEDRWAMLLDQEGRVVWSFRKPEELPGQYTVADVAAFT